MENRSSVSLSMLAACLFRCQAHMAREYGVDFCGMYILWCPFEILMPRISWKWTMALMLPWFDCAFLYCMNAKLVFSLHVPIALFNTPFLWTLVQKRIGACTSHIDSSQGSQEADMAYLEVTIHFIEGI